jgi:hypothetical protein
MKLPIPATTIIIEANVIHPAPFSSIRTAPFPAHRSW